MCIYMCMCVYIYIYIYIYTHIDIYVYVICMYVCMCIHNVCMHINIFILFYHFYFRIFVLYSTSFQLTKNFSSFTRLTSILLIILLILLHVISIITNNRSIWIHRDALEAALHSFWTSNHFLIKSCSFFLIKYSVSLVNKALWKYSGLRLQFHVDFKSMTCHFV